MSADRALPLFAYGTLQFEPILVSLIDRVPDSSEAIAVDFEARRLPGVSYPGLVSVRGGSAPGVLLHGLTPTEWERLDDYEDDFYELNMIDVRSTDGQPARALAYVVDARLASPLTWTSEWFEREHLNKFVGSLFD